MMPAEAGSFELFPGMIDIWHINIEPPPEKLAASRALLSPDELERAARFHFDIHRNRYIAGRAALRAILAQYLGVSAQAIAFNYGEKGKPALAPQVNTRRLEFNLSHSHERALLGITAGCIIGVDIERINLEFGTDEIATHFFSAFEVDTLLAVPKPERGATFFNCWTRKEAYIKAVGEGLSLPLDSFDVAFGPGVEAALLRVGAAPDAPSRWRMYDIPAPQGYAAAIAVEGTEHKLRQREWEW
ncbi:MAG TPA: 4'-phosphopantetheinyl transferase superfamily protein [Candidatus Angelobacter sp.]|nr:4'-phosphopantetheinyl transferase superfamily protein [Candidatus Angelobacter sp.]